MAFRSTIRAWAATALMAASLVAFSVPVAAAENSTAGAHPHKPLVKKGRKAADHPYGREGDPRKVKRVIRIDMSDAMRYFPDQVRVKRGDTVRFAVRNKGELHHEMVIGTMDELKRHAELMKKHGEMGQDGANVAHVAPGGTGRIVWQFTRAGEFYYGCLIPGHFDAGMIGTIVVR
jgi:uncharacterized cupredoxin-like copper-binding protein